MVGVFFLHNLHTRLDSREMRHKGSRTGLAARTAILAFPYCDACHSTMASWQLIFADREIKNSCRLSICPGHRTERPTGESKIGQVYPRARAEGPKGVMKMLLTEDRIRVDFVAIFEYLPPHFQPAHCRSVSLNACIWFRVCTFLSI